MFINNKVKRLVISCISIMAVGSITAGAASVDTKAKIDDVTAQMRTYQSYMNYAHSHAEAVRSTGADDDHEVIQSAKVLWNDASDNYNALVKQYNSLTAQYKIEVAAEEAAKKKAEEEKKKQEQAKGICLGTFKTTYYTGSWDEGGSITALGTPVSPWYTVAVDPNVIPLGSKIRIEGYNGIFYCADTGSAIRGNIIDIAVGSKSEASNLGVQYHKVYLVK